MPGGVSNETDAGDRRACIEAVTSLRPSAILRGTIQTEVMLPIR